MSLKKIDQASQGSASAQPDNRELLLGLTRSEVIEMVGAMIPPLAKTPDERIDETGLLEKGWYGMDGIEGEPITQEKMQWLKEFLGKTLTACRIPQPFIFPTVEGGYSVEWSSKMYVNGESQPCPISLEAVFNFAENKITLSALNTAGKWEEVEEWPELETAFALDDESAPKRFIEFFRQFSSDHQN